MNILIRQRFARLFLILLVNLMLTAPLGFLFNSFAYAVLNEESGSGDRAHEAASQDEEASLGTPTECSADTFATMQVSDIDVEIGTDTDSVGSSAHGETKRVQECTQEPTCSPFSPMQLPPLPPLLEETFRNAGGNRDQNRGRIRRHSSRHPGEQFPEAGFRGMTSTDFDALRSARGGASWGSPREDKITFDGIPMCLELPEHNRDSSPRLTRSNAFRLGRGRTYLCGSQSEGLPPKAKQAWKEEEEDFSSPIATPVDEDKKHPRVSRRNTQPKISDRACGRQGSCIVL